jgi:hypothetical protein
MWRLRRGSPVRQPGDNISFLKAENKYTRLGDIINSATRMMHLARIEGRLYLRQPGTFRFSQDIKC